MSAGRDSWDTVFMYPWKRVGLIANLKEMSDLEYQKTIWGKEGPNVYGGVFGCYDYFIGDEDLDKDAASAVGIYLLNNEVACVSRLAQAFLNVMHDLRDKYDNEEAIRHKDWPTIISLAAIALKQIEENNQKMGEGAQ